MHAPVTVLITKIILSFLILCFTSVATIILKKCLEQRLQSKPETQHLLGLLRALMIVPCWLIAILTILSIFNVDITAIVAGLGLTGFAISFACKDILSNTISGLMIMLQSPFKVGDEMSVKSHTGVVLEIGFKYTKLLQGDTVIFVPNTLLSKELMTIKTNS